MDAVEDMGAPVVLVDVTATAATQATTMGKLVAHLGLLAEHPRGDSSILKRSVMLDTIIMMLAARLGATHAIIVTILDAMMITVENSVEL